MDRNAITGLVLITVLTLVYFTFFSPDMEQPPAKDPAAVADTMQAPVGTDSMSGDTPPAVVTQEMDAEARDSVDNLRLQREFSDFYLAAEGEAKELTVTTEKLTVNLSTEGGKITSAFLNEYQTHDSLPLPIIQNHPNNDWYFQFFFQGAETKTIKSSDLYFEPDQAGGLLEVAADDSLVLRMVARIDEERYVEQVYTFYGDEYHVGYDIGFQGLEDRLGRYASYELNWTSYLPKTELSIDNMRQKSTVAYKQGESVEKMSISEDREEESVPTPVDWISFKSQFFSHIVIPDKSFSSASMAMVTPPTETINRVMTANMKVDWQRSNDIQNDFRIYLGPNEYYTLNSYKVDLEEEMDMGWWIISYINIGTTYIFKFLEGFISNYGIIVILLAILIRTLVLPLTFKSFLGMAKMRVLNQSDEMKALDEKYKEDPQKLQMAKMSVYREMGVSPLGGCLPMLFSYPFLIALFFFFPQSVELRQQSFLWANDLSTYDSIISWSTDIPLISSVYGNHVSLFTLLMAISTFFYTYYQQKSQPTQANPAMKYIAYILPVFLLVFLNNYASGLSLYYLTSNLLSIGQNFVIRQFIDDEKLLKDMRDSQKKGKKKKGKKGGGGKSRLERWAERQQQKQQEMSSQRQQGQAKNRQQRRQGKK